MDNTILLAAQSLAELLGWTILHSIWQITLIALVLRLLLSWASKYDATIRCALAISALFVATSWSIHTFLGTLNQVTFAEKQSTGNILEDNNNPEIPVATITFSPSSYLKKIEVQTAKIIAPMMPFLAVFWFVGILFFASRILVGCFRLHHFSNNGIQLLPSSWDTRLLKLKHLSGIHRPVVVRLSNLVETPITYRFFRPIILLPVSLFTGLSDEQIEVILLHELAHIKRQDYLVNLLQSCIEVMFFYHPSIWWISKQVRLEREHSCDDRVMNLRHNPMLYAQTLTQIQGQHYSFKTKLAMSATGNTGDFSKRIYRLFQQKEPSATLRNSAAALLLLFISGAMMAFYPTNADLSPMNNATIPTTIQDTIPPKLHKHKAGEENIWIEKTDGNTSIKNEAEINVLQTELVKLEKALHQSIKALKEEKAKEEETNESTLEALQLKAVELKNELHLKTKELKQLTNNSPKVFRIDTDKNDPIHLKSVDNELFTLKVLKGKKPIIYLDNEVYKKWKIDSEGKLTVDILTSEVHSVNIFKGKKALAYFGPDAADGVVYINTKENPTTIIPSKENKFEFHKDSKETEKSGNVFVLESNDGSDKKPLIILDGKVSQKSVKDINTDKIATMYVLKGEAALKKYGEKGKDGVVEVYTKGNEPKEKTSNGSAKIKLKGATSNSSNKEDENIWIAATGEEEKKKPLFVIDGKKLPAEAQNNEATLEGLSPDEIAHINVIKGAAALEKYGEEGVNGVVEITTKANKKALIALEKEQRAKVKEMKVKEKELKATKEKKKIAEKALKEKHLEMEVKEKEMKVKEKELKAIKDKKKIKEKALKAKHLELEAKEKEMKARKKELKAIKPVVPGNDIESPASYLSVFPNPTRQLTNIQLNLEEKGNVNVNILNINGQVVLNLVKGILEKGLHQYQWNSDNQPAGSYFVHFNLDGELMSKQVVIKQ